MFEQNVITQQIKELITDSFSPTSFLLPESLSCHLVGMSFSLGLPYVLFVFGLFVILFSSRFSFED